MTETLVLNFTHVGSTKNTHKFAEVGQDGTVLELSSAKLGTIYLKKEVFSGKTPALVCGTFTFT